MYKFEASKDGHTFTFDAPSGQHECIVALRAIGYTVTEIARLVYQDRYINAFGGRYMAHNVPTWVES